MHPVQRNRADERSSRRALYYANLAVQLELALERLRPAGCPEPGDDLDQRLVVDVLAELETMGVGEAGAALIDHVASGHECDTAIYAVSRASGQLYRQLPEVLESRFDVNERCDIVRRWRSEIPWNELAEGHPWIAQAIEPNDDVTEDPPPSMDRSAAELLGRPWLGVTPKRLLHRLTSMLRSDEREALVAALAAPGSARWIAFQALARLDDPVGVPAAERIIRDQR
jgi:hypothetical protein